MNRFRFADSTYDSLGKINIPLRTPVGQPIIFVEMDVVTANIPALLGMDIMDKESLTPCTVSNRLIKRVPIGKAKGEIEYCDQWHVPLTRSASTHLYAQMDFGVQIFFSKAQLLKIHRHFNHPSANKLFNLIKKARPEHATNETLEILKNISKSCDPCQRITTAPKRFRVTLGSEHVQFNEQILIDIMYIDGSPILHVVDSGTKFNAASFLKDKSIETVWKTLMQCWILIYTGMPNRIMVDQGTEFGDLFIHMAEENNVQVSKTGIEAHSSLGLCERYHQPLRTVYRKIIKQFPKINKSYALSLAVKSINDTLGPEGLVPSALVFGVYPEVYTISEQRRSKLHNFERAKVANYARLEMEKVMADLRLKRAETYAVPPASDAMFHKGEQVLVWREKVISNRIGEWIGPFTVERFEKENKLVHVNISGKIKPFNIAQIKSYHIPEEIAHSFIAEILSRLERFKNPYDVFDSFPTEVISEDDPRSKLPEMELAKRKEVLNLIKRGAFEVVLIDDIPKDANLLPGRFVLAIKSKSTGEILFKARYVIGGHRDKYKALIVHASCTIQPSSIRLLLALAKMLDFDIWTADARQAFLQAFLPIGREVYIKNPVKEFNLNSNQCLKLLRPLYGLADSGDLWYARIDEHHRKELKMKASKLDPALYYIKKNNILFGFSGGYVDDFMRAGNQEFKKLSNMTNEIFDMGQNEQIPTDFTGFSLTKDDKNNIFISQEHYLEKMEKLSESSDYSDFRSIRMKLAWLSNSRPDCLFEISQMAQVTDKIYKEKRASIIKRINRTIEYTKINPLKLKVMKLKQQNLSIVGFSDSSFMNNWDHSTQLGYVIFLMDDDHNVVPIFFKSYKARRITKSPMAGEVIAFSDMFDAAIALSEEMKTLLDQQIKVQLFTDSKSLFDVISKGSKTSEKRLMLDIAAAREGFKDELISNIGLVRSKHNIADGLTKEMNQSALRNILETGQLKIECNQWIIRNRFK